MAEFKSSSICINSTKVLNDGVEMPRFGLGSYMNHGPTAVNTIAWALQNGYVMIDSASVYGNEKEIGQAIRASEIPREKIFVVSKLWDDSHGEKAATDSFMLSLHKFGLEYLDLYLIHSPHNGKVVESWKALVELKKKGLVRSIGVSNFGIHHLEALRGAFPNDTPSVNQFELTPYLTRNELVQHCEEQGIFPTAYRPLTQGKMLKDPPLMEMAAKYSKTTAQVLIRWGLQRGFSVIPKSSKQERIKENADVFDFDISKEDMLKLNAFDRNAIFDWDPVSEPWIS